MAAPDIVVEVELLPARGSHACWARVNSRQPGGWLRSEWSRDFWFDDTLTANVNRCAAHVATEVNALLDAIEHSEA